MNDESVLITSVALCFGMVFLVTKPGFSAALGAFIMGSILAETTHAEKMEHLLKPVKDPFGAVFLYLYRYADQPRAFAGLCGPDGHSGAGRYTRQNHFRDRWARSLSGQPLKKVLQSGMSLSTNRRVSFIIANLGLSLKVTSGFLYPDQP